MDRILSNTGRSSIRLGILFLVLSLLVSYPAFSADHPPKDHRPIGAPEEMLSGVYVNSTGHHSIRNADSVLIEPLSEVLQTLGRPDDIVSKNRCEKTYIWSSGGVRLEVGMKCIFQMVQGHSVMRSLGAYSVEVWGERAQGSIGRTGRGLALGDSMAKMKRLYELRCECGRYVSGTGDQDTHGERYEYYAQYQWGEKVKLDIDADAEGRIVHILLMGDLE